MPWWMWFGGGVFAGHALRLFMELRHDMRCPEITTISVGVHVGSQRTLRCRLHDGHAGPCEAGYRESLVDASTTQYWTPARKLS